MLEYLHLKNVGPAPEMEMELAPRLNLITGDNGLGKSFLLDIAWWSMTRKWPAEVNAGLTSGLMARPSGAGEASIEFRFTGMTTRESYRSVFNRKDQGWGGRSGRPSNPGLVLYATADGGFSVWDPARNYWKKRGLIDVQDRPAAYVFSPREVWQGLRVGDEVACTGLLLDWVLWLSAGGDRFAQLEKVLQALSPPGGPLLVSGPLVRLGLDARDMPTLTMPYGADVPLLHASAGMRRVIALAYVLVWAWQEHVLASRELGQPTARQVVFLVDEVEAHLHPRWQRQILRGLLAVMEAMIPHAKVQLIAATHSPLILASAEPMFDRKRDAWFDLDLVHHDAGARVELRRRTFVRHGDAAQWLTSEAFDLGSARSLDAEKALDAAAVALSDPKFDKRAARKIDGQLREVLGEHDPFWMRWRFFGEQRGWLAPGPPSPEAPARPKGGSAT
jgi:hypothetical protein